MKIIKKKKGIRKTLFKRFICANRGCIWEKKKKK